MATFPAAAAAADPSDWSYETVTIILSRKSHKFDFLQDGFRSRLCHFIQSFYCSYDQPFRLTLWTLARPDTQLTIVREQKPLRLCWLNVCCCQKQRPECCAAVLVARIFKPNNQLNRKFLKIIDWKVCAYMYYTVFQKNCTLFIFPITLSILGQFG